ncbi:MAG: prenyltransferase/squalene oxidase repeat-containing protein [Actinomycetota bacterium]
MAQSVGIAGGVTVTPAVDNALTNLAGQQQADGSFIGFDGTINATIGVVLAVSAADRDPRLMKAGGSSPLDYLATQTALLGDPSTASANTAKIAQLILALTSIGEDPHSFGGVDWITLLNSTYDPVAGKYGSFYIHHPWAILALASAGESLPAEAVTYLTSSQEDSGAFAFNGKGTGGDTNATALCLQALAAVGQSSSSAGVQNAIAYLHTQQNTDGGFPWANPSAWGTDSDSCSTSWVIQGLVSAGEDPAGSAWTTGGNTPFTFLSGMQNPSGAFGLMKSWSADDLMSTYQAVPALLSRPFPFYADLSGDAPAAQPGPGSPGTSPSSSSDAASVQSTGSSPQGRSSGSGKASASGAGTGASTITGQNTALNSTSSGDGNGKGNIAAGAKGVSDTLKKLLYGVFGFLGGSAAFLAIAFITRKIGLNRS